MIDKIMVLFLDKAEGMETIIMFPFHFFEMKDNGGPLMALINAICHSYV